MKKRLCGILACALVLTACGGQAPEPDARADGKMTIVATVFPAYDFARAAAGELAEVSLLLPPGAESHSYEPTPADILAVQGCDLFLYLGGESDAWVDTILEAIEPTGEAMRMLDCVDLLEEETVAGMQAAPGHDHEDHGHGQVVEMDEHVWTSPRNAAAITSAIGERLSALDPANQAAYAAGAAAYAAQLEALDLAFRDFFSEVGNPVMIFGDRFPLRYFAEAYDLDYYAAFPGCSTQTEPSAATIAFLTGKVKEEGIGTVYYIEFSNHLVADGIAEAAGADTALFHTCHNVSRQELDGGATYLSLMEGNLETLRRTMPAAA